MYINGSFDAPYGDVAQMEARHVRKAEAKGLIPTASTRNSKKSRLLLTIGLFRLFIKLLLRINFKIRFFIVLLSKEHKEIL